MERKLSKRDMAGMLKIDVKTLYNLEEKQTRALSYSYAWI